MTNESKAPFQSFSTGLWGYGEHAGCPDLNTCAYPTREAAVAAQGIDAQIGAIVGARLAEGLDPRCFAIDLLEIRRARLRR